MTPARLATALILLSFLFASIAFLSGCVSIPIPPIGDRQGELGAVQVSLSLKYLPVSNPDLPESSGDTGLAYAWSQFGKSQTLFDK